MKKLSALLICCCALLVPFAEAASAPNEPPPAPAFDVMEYVVQGNTVLAPLLVEQAVEPYLGPDKTFKDLEAARAALEKAYQDAGFLSVVVSLPDQRVDTGEVVLDVTQAEVGQLKITGAQYHLPSRIREGVPSLAPGQVPYFPQVQDELAKVQSASLQVTPLIAAGDHPEQIQVELKVEDKPAFSASVELNSRQSFNTDRGRLEANASYNNLFQLGHSLGLSWQYAPTRPSDANTLAVIYGLPLSPEDDLTFSFTNSSSDTPTGTSVGGATLTRGRFYGVRWQHQLDPFQWPAQHSVFVALDYKDNRDRNQSFSGFTTEKPPQRYPVLSAGYDLSWQGENDTSTALRTSLATSTRAWAGRQVNCDGIELDQFECKRAGARPDFLVWKVGIDHRRGLGGQWRLNASADAQVASGPLASGEQYSLGGIDTVRGYYDYEQAGDQGWNARLEVVSPAWLSAGSWRASSLGFVDRGFVMLKDPLAGQVARVHLGSYGLGLRVDNG
ncbi:MAG: ShlB/FhaC/HecB family hemolysin secretion/activation protein, partial [Rubrivivax sp.]